MLLRWMYNNPQSVGGSTVIHKGASNGRSTKMSNGDREA
jgi:hypothetical protein